MKKLIALLLVVVMVMSLAACGGQKKSTGNQDATKATVKPANEAEFAAAEAEIRYALGLLLDRNYITEQISQAGELPANTFVAAGMADSEGTFEQNSNGGKGYYSVAAEDYSKNVKEGLEILKK